MKTKGKQFKLILCLVLAITMVGSAFAAGNWYFSARALSDGETGVEEEYTSGDDEPSADEPAAIADDGMEVGGICYALWYDNGDLVFQLTDEPDENGRTLTGSCLVDTSLSYSVATIGAGVINRPWTGTNIKKVIFEDVIRPKNMGSWFKNMSSLTAVEKIENLDVSNVTSLNQTFYACGNLTELDVSGWEITTALTNLSNTFYGCSKLDELDLRNWDASKVTSTASTFYNGPRKLLLGENFKFSDTSAFDLTYWLHVETGEEYSSTELCEAYNADPINMAGTYVLCGMGPGGYCYALLYDNGDLVFQPTKEADENGRTLVNSYYFSTSTNHYNSIMIPWQSKKSSVYRVIFADVIRPKDMEYWFSSMSNLTEFVNIENLDTSAVTNMESTFSSSSKLTELDVSGFNTEKVTSMYSAFSGCSGLTELDVSGWDVSKVTNMESVFNNCSSLTTIGDTSGWNMSSVTIMKNMFNNCSSLTELDVNGWQLDSLKEMNNAFYNCSSLTELNVKDWNIPKVTNMDSAFYGCTSLAEIDLSGWNIQSEPTMNNTFRKSATRFILGDSFKFFGTTVLEPAYWLREETGEHYSSDELYELYNDDPANMTGTYIWDEMDTGGRCYAIMYENGDLVFRQSLEFDSDRGEPIDSWTVFTFETYSSTTVPWYSYRANVKKIVFEDEILPERMDYWFYSMSSLTDVEAIENLKTEGLTSLYYTFYNCSSLIWLDTSGWDLSSLTTLYGTFYDCSALVSLDSGNWKLTNLTSLAYAFRGCTSLPYLDTRNWDLPNLTSLNYAFYGCGSLTELDTGNWSLPKVTTLQYAFYNCSKLTELDTGNWDLQSVTTLNYAFYGCKALTSLGSTNWDLSKLTSTGLAYTFYGCEALLALDTSSWGDMSNITSLNYSFYNCKSLASLDVSNWTIGKVTTLAYAFTNCTALTGLDVSGWDVAKVTSMDHAFSGCSGLISLDLSSWNTDSLTTFTYAFNGCTSLTDLNASDLNLSKVTSLSYAFQNCSSLAELDVSGWNVSAVTTMQYAFNGCSSLTSLDMNDWDVSKVTNMSYMLQNCSSLTDLKVKNWKFADTATVTVTAMLTGCTSLTALDVSGWEKTSGLSGNIDYASGYPSSLMEITFGPGLGNLIERFELGKSASARWAEYAAETTMSVAELYAFHEGLEGETRTYYRVHTVTFDANGGIAVPSSIGEWWPGKDIGELPTATRRGADFDGWWTEIVGGEQIKDGEMPTHDIYYAHWIEHKYTLILDSNNGTLEQVSVVLEYSQSYKLSSTLFTDPWAVITAWHTRPAGNGIYGANEELIAMTEEDGGEIRLYAQWTSLENIVTITFDSQGGTEVPQRQMERGDIIGNTGKLPVPVKSGFSFAGWYIQNEDGSLGDKADENTVVNSDITLVAKWQIDLVVQFDFNMGINSTIITRSVIYGEPVGTPPVDIYNGRYQALIGWFTDPSGGEQIDADRIITEDVTFYAHWGWRPRFNANGGKFTDPSYLAAYPITENSYYTIEEFPEVEYDGYRLVGWYHGDNEVKPGDTVDLSKSTEIYAVWERDDTIKITLLANGGIMKRADENATYDTLIYEVYAGKRVAELPIPTRAGYEFLGWADLTQQIPDEYCDRDSVFYQNATLIACWVQQDCTVTFDRVEDDARFYNTSAATKTVNVPTGWTVNTLPGCTRTESDYILEGWYTEKDGQGEKLTKDTPITGDITYYAYWVPFKNMGFTELHEYTYGAEWTNANNANVDNCGNNLEFHPTNNEEQVAQLHLSFELNNSYGEGGALPTGSVYIKIPKYIFFDENGNDIGECNLTTWLAEYPNQGAQNFSYIDGGDCYYLVNNQPLDTGGISITIEYSVTPNKLEGGAINEDGRYVEGYDYFYNEIEIEFGVKEEPGDFADPKPWLDPDSRATKDLSLEMHTKVDTTATKSFSSFVYEWDEKTWGKKPADADDYFYIIWRLSETYKSYTNQPSVFQWSEDETVHDGTIIYISSGESGSHSGSGYGSTSTCTVVTKHPRELLDDIPPVGRTFYNEAIVTETWESDYVTQHRVNAKATIYPDDYGWGEFDKDRYNSSHLISGGQEDILDDHKEIDMPWIIEYDGGSNVRPTWDEETKQYYAPNRTIRITDGVRGDLLYSSGRASSKYVWEPNTGNFDLNDDDYYFYSLRLTLTEYDAISEDDVWSEKIAVTETSKYEPIEIWVRYKDTDSFVFYQSVKYTGTTTVSLPENVVGFRVFHTSSFYWTKLTIMANMKLVPTQKIMTWVQSDVDARTTSIIKNEARCDIWLTEEGEESTFFHASNRGGDYSSALDDLYELNISSTYQYTTKSAGEVRIDPNTGTEDVPMLIRGYNYNPSGRMKKLKSGVFYDLLPTGTSVDTNTVICIPEVNQGSVTVGNYDNYVNSSSKLDPSMYDVRFEQDWEGSGRTMMIIRVAIPENRYPSIAVLYMLHNTYENIKLSGLTVTNDVAFVNTSEGRVWPDGLDGHITDLPMDDQGFYEDLLLNNEGFISFAQASARFTSPAVQTWAFDKRVMTNDAYKVSDTTLPGKTYTYRLSYSQSSSTYSKNMVLYDILEQSARRRNDNGTPTDPIISAWQGAFVSVDVVSSFKNEQVTELKPIIYYSTVDRDRFNLEPVTNPADYDLCDLSKTDNWSTEIPEDKSTITAIAVDFSKNTEDGEFTMNGEGTLEVYITMLAPTDVEDFIDETAYNEGVLYAQQGTSETVTPLYSDAQVTLRDVNPGLEKVSDPESGTKKEPTILKYNDEITYTLKITNTDEDLIMYDIVVEDEVPKGLYIVENEIMVHFGDPSTAVPVDKSPRVVRKDKEDQKLIFTISSLRPGETMHIEIPVIVTVTSAVFENRAEITEVDGIEKEIKSKPTYHEVLPSASAVLQIEKKLIGRAEPIEEDEFSFIAELIAIDGKAVSPEEAELNTYDGSTIGASGWVSIGPIDYEADAEGHTYKYRIAEVIGTDKHIKYFEDTIYALVEIVDTNPDDELNAYLVANRTYYTDENCTRQIEGSIPIVENKYVGGADIEILKVITGEEKVIEVDEFTFTAIEVDNNTLEPVANGRTINGSTTGEDGRVTFDPISYSSDDADKTYTFKITEDKGNEAGMTYSDEVIYAQLTFTLEEDNSLSYEVTYFTVSGGERTPLDNATITNTYAGELPIPLPDWGGMGIAPYMISGATLVLLAIAMAYVTKAKKKKHN